MPRRRTAKQRSLLADLLEAYADRFELAGNKRMERLCDEAAALARSHTHVRRARSFFCSAEFGLAVSQLP